MGSVSLMCPRGRWCFSSGSTDFFNVCKFGVLSVVKSCIFLLGYYYVCIVRCSVIHVVVAIVVVVDGGGSENCDQNCIDVQI